jgi:glycine oxidase
MEQLLIVGGGLAGTILAAESYQRGISFRWIMSPHIPTASLAAYGMCNPVHFKNKVPTWKAEELFNHSTLFFKGWQEKLDTSFYFSMPVHHLVVDDAEFIQWRQNVESTHLWKYTNGEPQTNMLPLVQHMYLGSILIDHAFFVAIPTFIQQIKNRFIHTIEQDEFNFTQLEHLPNSVTYKGEAYERIIFADGYTGSKNPYFQQVPFNPCKGQILILEIPGLKLHTAIHKKVVLLPMGSDQFICGATYEWDDLSNEATERGRAELLTDVQQILGPEFTIKVIDQKAGVRPTISDRRPVVGWHPISPNIGILNGFGTRGLLVGPSCANNLLNSWQDGEPIMDDWNVHRFKKRILKNS